MVLAHINCTWKQGSLRCVEESLITYDKEARCHKHLPPKIPDFVGTVITDPLSGDHYIKHFGSGLLHKHLTIKSVGQEIIVHNQHRYYFAKVLAMTYDRALSVYLRSPDTYVFREHLDRRSTGSYNNIQPYTLKRSTRWEMAYVQWHNARSNS